MGLYLNSACLPLSAMSQFNAQIIPEGDSVFFSNWAGPTELPSPDKVREHANVLDCHAAVIVCFLHLDLVVKYGPHVRATKGQALCGSSSILPMYELPLYMAGSRMEMRCFFI